MFLLFNGITRELLLCFVCIILLLNQLSDVPFARWHIPGIAPKSCIHHPSPKQTVRCFFISHSHGLLIAQMSRLLHDFVPEAVGCLIFSTVAPPTCCSNPSFENLLAPTKRRIFTISPFISFDSTSKPSQACIC